MSQTLETHPECSTSTTSTEQDVQSSFACFFSGCALNILRDFGERCESAPLDRTGSYVSISINITKILACVVQVDAFLLSVSKLVTSAL